MATILSDKNCEGHTLAIFHTLVHEGYANLLNIQFLTFAEVGLDQDSDDQTVWRFCQEQGHLLITGNRRTVDGDNSLEIVTQREATEDMLPVLTIGNLNRVLADRYYCDRCADAIATILIEPEKFRGIPRLYNSVTLVALRRAPHSTFPYSRYNRNYKL